jgi:hypothetical protein
LTFSVFRSFSILSHLMYPEKWDKTPVHTHAWRIKYKGYWCSEEQTSCNKILEHVQNSSQGRRGPGPWADLELVSLVTCSKFQAESTDDTTMRSNFHVNTSCVQEREEAQVCRMNLMLLCLLCYATNFLASVCFSMPLMTWQNREEAHRTGWVFISVCLSIFLSLDVTKLSNFLFWGKDGAPT